MSNIIAAVILGVCGIISAFVARDGIKRGAAKIAERPFGAWRGTNDPEGNPQQKT